MVSLKMLCSATFFATSILMASCTTVKTASTPEHHNIGSHGDFSLWDGAVKDIVSGDSLSQYNMKDKYTKSHAYHPVYMGQLWIEDMASIAAQNKPFSKAVINQAAGNKTNFARKLQKNPQIASTLPESHGAFRDVLSFISTQDAEYRNISQFAEAYARRQSAPKNKLSPRNISYFSLHDYSTTSAVDPSVMERILNIAAFKILELDQDDAYRQHISRLTHNNAMTRCFETAKRNSRQCEAAAYDAYDLSYCMARHNVSEVAGCFSWMLP